MKFSTSLHSYLLVFLMIPLLLPVPMSGAEEVCKAQKQDLVYEVSLPPQTKDEWLNEILKADLPDYKNGDQEALEAFIETSAKIASPHLMTLRDTLVDFGGEIQAALIRNLPQDPNVPATPVDRRTLDKTTFIAEAVSVGVASFLGGSLVSYPGEKQYSNPYFHEGFALKKGGSALNHCGTLLWHIDMSYCPLSFVPDLLMLCGIREGNDKKVKTMFMRATDVLQLVPASVERILRENRFKHKQPDWISTLKSKPKPVVVGSLMNPTILTSAAGNATAFDPDDLEAQQALEVLYGAIKKSETCGLAAYVHMQEGDLLVFDQKHMLHSRKAYSAPLFDGNDRILLRSYYLYDEELVDLLERQIHI